MYNLEQFKELTTKYSSYSSWAVWDYANPHNTEIIENNIKHLHSNYVLLGLNISRILDKKPWSNFHDNTHARKIMYACNDTYLRGSYMTDLFKDIPESVSLKLEKRLSDEVIDRNINFFCKEMKDIKLGEDSQFIIFGQMAGKYFSTYFKKYFKNEYKIVRHYSDFRINDLTWVTKFWEIMNIKGDAETTVMKYKKNL